MKNKKARVVCFSVSAVILALVLAITIVVGALHGLLDRWVIGYKPGENGAANRAAGEQLTEQIQSEGSVLVQNNGSVLPLNKRQDTTLNVFGWASVDWVYSGSGSGRTEGNMEGTGNNTKLYDLYAALEDYGITYNEQLRDMYKKFKSRRDNAEDLDGVDQMQANAKGSLHSFNYEFSKLYEPSITDTGFYSQQLLDEAKKFSDIALVVIGRVSGESNDSPKVQYKKNSASNSVVTDESRTYLEISTEEEDLLKYVGQNYQKVIVLINSTNVIELGFLEKIDGLDSCLVVATTGTSGAKAIPKLLYGEYNPSGKLADTYAYDLSTSSTYVNTGSGVKGKNDQGDDTTNFYLNQDGTAFLKDGLYPTTVDHTNGSSNVPYSGVAYTDYAESIYVGYKWYETADADGFWDSQAAKDFWKISNGYKDVVQYPFGYGMSYSQFEWEITVAPLDNEAITDQSEIEIEVKVTNKGPYPGQDVVELYYTPPYTPNGIEKSAVNLVAFGKTQQILEPNESEAVVLKFKAEDMKSYDYLDANGNGFKGYELEEGTYTLSLRTDAHTLATGKLGGQSAEIKLRVGNDLTLATDSTTGNAVANRFTGTDTTDGVAIDGNSDGTAKIKYLTRTNFATSFPFEQAANRTMDDRIRALNLYTADMAKAWDKAHNAEALTTGASGEEMVYENGQLTDLGRQIGKEENFANEALWNPVLDKLTINEMQNLVLHGYTKTMPLNSIGKPETLDLDGPNQLGSFDNDHDGATGFSSIVLAQTWNIELAYSMGMAVATEAAETLQVEGWYGPAINLHRSPFGGRNYEYYSEDPLISGLMSAKAVQAAKNGGVFSYLKHLCLYESESGRDGMYNWITEQALREMYIKPFEICVKEGGATGIMTSYGRIGAVWTGGSEALLTEVVRNEWGFKGAILTDYADHHEFMNGDQMLRAGGDLWMDGVGDGGRFKPGYKDENSNAFNIALRNASKHVIYMWANALETYTQYNEDVASGKIEEGVVIHKGSRELNFRWYIPVVAALDAVALIGCGLWIFFTLKKKPAAEAPQTEQTEQNE